MVHGTLLSSLLPLYRSHIQIFNFLSCPFGFAEKFQAGIDGRIMCKTTDSYSFSKSFPSILIDQIFNHINQPDTMQWIIRLSFGVLVVIIFHFSKIRIISLFFSFLLKNKYSFFVGNNDIHQSVTCNIFCHDMHAHS